jgi:protocatechuate 3,4-dioxygenase beta subunit
MTATETKHARLGRRELLHGMGAGVVILGCGTEGEPMGGGSSSGASTGDPSDGPGSTSSSSGAADSSASSVGVDSSSAGADSSSSSDDSSSTGTPERCEPAREWAAGGTASMTAQDCYPDPFAAGVPSCALLCQTTAGPCTSTTIERQDVSEGLAGVPVRLALKLVTADGCEPVAGAFVEIWHTQRTGVYSGLTPSMICNGDDPRAAAQLYFRGSQTTDAEGRVDFDTCYPGWYPGRAIHIHVRVILNGDEHLVSQLFFDDGLIAEIFVSHPDYAEFGAPNTNNQTDGVIAGVRDKSPYILDSARMPDGAMLASKVIAIRSSPPEPLCTA